MTAQDLLYELLNLQKQGFDLNALDVATETTSFLNGYSIGVEVEDSKLVIYLF
jgi:hypothetical protein